MSYQIISKSFNGNITVENSELKYLNDRYIGVKFKIVILPIYHNCYDFLK